MNNKKKKLSIIAIISLILLLFAFSTTAYSAISSTVKITGNAYAKIESNIRITNFSINSTSNGVSNYEEFSKNTIQTEVILQANSYISYNLEITNYGNIDMGILDITGLPENINYEIENYTLKDKICDDTGKCNNHAKKTYILKLYTTSASFQGIVNLHFDFRPFYKITYVNFLKTYKSEFIAGDHFFIDLANENPTLVSVIGDSSPYYKYDDGILEINNAESDIEIKALSGTFTYDYTGEYQTFIAPSTGIYKIELWGAQGNNETNEGTKGGNGAYTSGEIELQQGQKLYIYVGQKGISKGNDTTFNNGTGSSGGWNGGGSTDIRIVEGAWNSSNSINSRIMVAAGGGTGSNSGVVGAAGGLIGYPGGATTGGTQTSFCPIQHSFYTSPSFGIANGGCTGGNGYYPGTASACSSGSAGGSSFISGHNGCVAIESSISTTPRNDSNGSKCADGTTDITCSYHYSNFIFKNTMMIDGAGYKWTTEKQDTMVGMPTFDGNGTMIGNESNGFAKITIKNPNNEHKITYNGITGSYQQKIKTGQTLTINFSSNAPSQIIVLAENEEHKNYTYANGILTVNNVVSDLIISTYPYTYRVNYTGQSHQYIVPVTGTYKIELWGASGGDDMLQGIVYENTSGLGGYTSGTITLEKNTNLYIYVGGRGGQPVLRGNTPGGYNGGGSASHDADDESSGGGGGATDIRLIAGEWNNELSLKSRIMVAGGGASDRVWRPNNGESQLAKYVSPYCSGGGLKGYTIVSTSSPGTQTTGYAFGIGESGLTASSDTSDGGSDSGLPGAGGGYYGGTSGDTNYYDIAAGGSSFISGHNGCVAIESYSSLTPRKDSSGNSCTDGTTDIMCSYHYSNYKFINTVMIDGAGYNWTTSVGDYIGMPTFDGTSTMKGNTSNGYAKISLLQTN